MVQLVIYSSSSKDASQKVVETLQWCCEFHVFNNFKCPLPCIHYSHSLLIATGNLKVLSAVFLLSLAGKQNLSGSSPIYELQTQLFWKLGTSFTLSELSKIQRPSTTSCIDCMFSVYSTISQISSKLELISTFSGLRFSANPSKTS